MMLELIATASTIALGTGIAPFFMNWLADGDVLFTKVKEGTAKAIMTGDTFHHFVLSHRGYHLNDPRWKKDPADDRYDNSLPAWEIVPNPDVTKPGGKPPEVYDNRGWLLRKLGLYWVGLPPFRSVYEYNFVWNEEKVDTTGKPHLWNREGTTNFIYTSKFPYLVVIDSAETEDRLPLDGMYQLTVQINNPFSALFHTENWLESVTGYSNRQARNFIGARKYGALVSETKVTGDPNDERFSTTILELNTALPGQTGTDNGTRKQNGVTIISADLQQLEITGDQAGTIRAATLKAYTADQDAYATVAAGEAEGKAELARGTAKAAVITLTGKAVGGAYKERLNALKEFGDLAPILLQTDAMSAEGPGRTIIWANNPFIASKPGLAEALEGLGIKTPEDLRDLMQANLKAV